MKDFVDQLSNDSSTIKSAKEVFPNKELPGQLAIIKANFKILTNSITKLEGHQSLVESIRVIEEVEEKLNLESYDKKVRDVLQKNPGLEKLRRISRVIRGSAEDFEGDDLNMPSLFANAPVTSVDCERICSKFKDLLSSKRMSLTESHIRDVIVQWNSKEAEQM